jgi:hypothetical protein
MKNLSQTIYADHTIINALQKKAKNHHFKRGLKHGLIGTAVLGTGVYLGTKLTKSKKKHEKINENKKLKINVNMKNLFENYTAYENLNERGTRTVTPGARNVAQTIKSGGKNGLKLTHSHANGIKAVKKPSIAGGMSDSYKKILGDAKAKSKAAWEKGKTVANKANAKATSFGTKALNATKGVKTKVTTGASKIGTTVSTGSKNFANKAKVWAAKPGNMKKAGIGLGVAALGAGAYKLGKSRANKKKLNEAVEFGISPKQFFYDVRVLHTMKNLSESHNVDYLEVRNQYLVEQRDSALQSGCLDAATYYNAKIVE